MGAKKSSKAVLRDDLVFTGISSNGYTIPMDSTLDPEGHDAGASPVELVLTALAGCTGMDVISILRKKQQQVTAFEVQVEGVRTDEFPKLYTEIWVRYIVTGHNVNPAAVERAIELSSEKYCAVSAILRATAKMHYDYEIVEAAEEVAQ